jgi:SAM-dependent methyltransferase
MNTKIHNRPYKYLAEFYDRIFPPVDLSTIQEAARHAVMGSILPRVQSACDLACGSGTTAVSFAKSGIRTFAVDNSSGMCRLVREKARRAGVVLRVLQADMRGFHLPEQVDLFICEGDAINHLDCKAELTHVARSVAGALRSGAGSTLTRIAAQDSGVTGRIRGGPRSPASYW